MQYTHDEKRFIQLLSDFTGIQKSKLNQFIKVNPIKHLFDHPTAMEMTEKQRDKLEELKELRNLYQVLREEARQHTLDSSTRAGEYFKEYFHGKNDREYFVCAFLNNQNQILATKVVQEGTLNESAVYPREIAKAALMHDAKSVIISHNHPGGSLNPSQNDIAVTGVIGSALKTLKIDVLDHIIVAADQYCSLSERGLMNQTTSKDAVMEKGAKFQRDSNKDGSENMVQQAVKKLEQGIMELFESKKYIDYLKTMSRFHEYSFGNTLLIMLQKPGATRVAGFKAWAGMERNVKKGEKGIQILAPQVHKRSVDVEVLDPVTRQPVKDSDGNNKTEKKTMGYTTFRPVYVFDISQTEGKPLPEIASKLQGSLDNYSQLFKAISSTSRVMISFEPLKGSRGNGYFDPVNQKIAIKNDLSEAQTVKTLIHELAHSRLHGEADLKRGRNTIEVEAESIAFIVSDHYKLDTSSYSFGYIAAWSSSKDLDELKHSLGVIQAKANKMIGEIDKQLERFSDKNRESVLTQLYDIQESRKSKEIQPITAERER